MKTKTLNKIILFLVQDYIVSAQSQKTKEGKQVQTPPQLTHLRASIAGFKKFHMFTIEEAEELSLIAKEEGLLEILDQDVSYIIVTMELMKLWTQTIPKNKRPVLISDKHFKLGGSYFWNAMIYLKSEANDEYIEKKNTIDNSKKMANDFWEYHYNKLKD